MAKEYEQRHKITKNDKTQPPGGMGARYADDTPWQTVGNMMIYDFITTTLATFKSGGVFRWTTRRLFAPEDISNYLTTYRVTPYTKTIYLNMLTALGWTQAIDSGHWSFVIGQIDNAGVAHVMKFKIVAWGTTSNAIQVWNKTTGAYETIGTLTFGAIKGGQFIVIACKMNLETGYMTSLQIGSLFFDLSAYALETDISKVYDSGLVTPAYNTGIVGIENTQIPTSESLYTYMDKIRTYRTSV